MNIVFFGSSTDSVIVLDTLFQYTIHNTQYTISAVVTQPAKPVGRKKILTATPVERWAKEKKIPVLTFLQNADRPWLFQNNEDVVNSIETFKPSLIVTACFGQKIPMELIEHTPHGAINVHPSLLPRWRGGDPVPWTILAGDAQTGVTITTVTKNFDDGKILAQKKIPVTEKITPSELRTDLFTLGAHLLIEILPKYIDGSIEGIAQKLEDVTIARRLTRDDGFVSWNEFFHSLNTQSPVLERKLRAFFPWPGVWSLTPFQKRLKLIALSPSILVQIEGKKPVDWKTFQKAYLPS